MSNKNKVFATEDGFKEYVAELDWVIDLDSKSINYPKLDKVADYYIKDIAVIELKTLRSDPKHNVASFMTNAINELYGKKSDILFLDPEDWTAGIRNEIASDINSLNKGINDRYFRKIEEILRNADAQLKATIKNLEALPKLHGVVIVIFEAASFYNPQSIAERIDKMMISKRSDGRFRLSNINQVILLQESHKMDGEGLTETFIPRYHIYNKSLGSARYSERVEFYIDKLLNGYVNYCDMNAVQLSDGTTLSSINLKPIDL